MTKVDPAIVAARAEVERTRAQLINTARELQNELLDLFSPHTLASDIWESAKEKGVDLAEEAVDAVRRRPAIVSGVVAAITLFLAREPLIGLAGKLTETVKTKRKAKSPRKPRQKQSKTETIA